MFKQISNRSKNKDHRKMLSDLRRGFLTDYHAVCLFISWLVGCLGSFFFATLRAENPSIFREKWSSSRFF